MQKTNLKIIRIISRLNIGGPAQNVIFLSEDLENKGFHTLLVAGLPEKDEGDMAYLVDGRALSLEIVKELSRKINLFKDLVAFFKILTIIFREKPDIIHTHTAKAGAIGRIAAFIYKSIFFWKKILVFHTFHGHVLEGYFGQIESSVFITIERFLGLFTDRIIVVSKSVRDAILKLKITSSEKILVVRLGLELEKFFSIEQKKQGLDIIKIGLVGRLAPIKNHKMFINCAKSFRETDLANNVKFIIVGDGELKEELVSYVKDLSLEDLIEFRGWVNDLVSVYSELDIVCLTSLNEGTPVSLIEALASGRPIISTNVGGVKDIISPVCQMLGLPESWLLVPPNGLKHFFESLNFLLDNQQLRAKIGEYGRIYVKNNFLKERLIKDMDLLYTNFLKRS